MLLLLTNFPDDVNVNDLWFEFGRFGYVGEVYIPKKLNKQGRRFGFVKYREVRDALDLLFRLEDIWFGSFKLRVNLTRFGKGNQRSRTIRCRRSRRRL
jgi:RNA recognition motif-containing protein